MPEQNLVLSKIFPYNQALTNTATFGGFQVLKLMSDQWVSEVMA